MIVSIRQWNPIRIARKSFKVTWPKLKFSGKGPLSTWQMMLEQQVELGMRSLER